MNTNRRIIENVYKKVCGILIIIIVITSNFIGTEVKAETTFDVKKVDQFMDTAMKRFKIPGASLGIVKGDKIVYLNGYGIAGPNHQPVTPQTPFVLGSTSKSFTALAIMQLVDKGMIDLEAPVQRYLPWFRVADEEASKKILVKDLLHQTSGLSTYDGRVSLTHGNKSIEEHIRSLKNTALTKPVGSVFQYSNLNYDILSGIVQAVSQESYTQYVRNHIFEPINMNHSYGNSKEAKNDGLATGYQPLFGFMVPTKQLNHEATVASGYLISTAEDMSNYLITQMNRGRFKSNVILSEESTKRMHKPSSSMRGGPSYAMGWSVNKNVIFHDGLTENTYSFMAMEGEYGFILLTNAQDPLISYDSIIAGINGIVHGQDRSQADMPDYTKIYLIVDLVALVVLALVTRSIYSLFKWRKKHKTTPARTVINVLFILIFNILSSLAVLFLLPKITSVPWSAITLFMPGVGHLLYYLSILLLCVGVLKMVLIIRIHITKNKTKGLIHME
ncbi:serine hydrolase domain-containing protein [Bacillus pseudomycoides]|uniref:Serine hydrolase domain-containing protein n=1 Tax=Bacillus bingmayongensis TaxID=1150157 RepID=A0ABU5K254_9BACI|nr:serine hydrolase domain-containing protein [Bacillus pseudomycoides]